LREWATKSALIRYLYHNLKISRFEFFYDLGKNRNGERYAANVDVHDLVRYRGEIEQVVAYTFDKLAQENPGKQIIVVMDAPRADVYRDAVESSPVIWLHRVMESCCKKNGIFFLDMTAAFSRSFKLSGERFESRWDGHWNELGHRVVAQLVLAKLSELGLHRPGHEAVTVK
jgi:hypothetical protein